MESLTVVDLQVPQNVYCGRRLDALRDDDRPGLVREAAQRTRQRPARRIDIDVRDQLTVELDDVGGELEDVKQAGEPVRSPRRP